MPDRRKCLCAAVPIALAFGLAACWAVRAPRIGTSLYDLVGKAAERIPQFVRDQSSREVSVIVSSKSRSAAEAVASELRQASSSPSLMPPGAPDFLRRERAGLVSAEVAQLLETREGRAKIARRALRRFYSSPVPPLLGWQDDPFFLTDGFVSSLRTGRTVIETNGMAHVLVKTTELPQGAVKAPSDVVIRACGVPVHAARSAEKCRREINVLTVFSLGFIALLSVLVFRSFRWIPLLACSLAVSALSGGIALCVVFAEVHLISLVFGTTVLGLVIDYSFHWLLADPAKRRETRRNLLLSFLTTETSLAPLAFSSIPALSQAAVFLGVGLAAALFFVLEAYPISPLSPSHALPCQAPSTKHKPPPRIASRILCSIVAALALAGLARLQVKTDVTSIYRPPPDLLEAEQLRAMFGSFDVSAFPSLPKRRRLASLVRTLYREQGESLRKEGLSLTPPPDPTFVFVSPKAFLNDLFDQWTHSTLAWLATSLVAMFLMLTAFFRKRAVRVFMPSLFALVAVVGLLALCGVSLNLFHLLACFLLAGMGVDYTVFLHSGERTAFRSVGCSLLTSMAGFGALAFVSMPIAVSFGQVLGMGLPLAFLGALALMPQQGDEVEKAASPLGLELLWWVYRLFGLRALHATAACVGVSAWLFSPAVRQTASSLRNVILFTRSLADKLAVMAGGRRLPTVETDGAEDASAFVDDVRQGRGVFVLSSHVGCAEALAALGACERTFHAWMDFDRTGVFTNFYRRHVKRPRVILHAISDFGIGTVFEAGTFLDSGDCVLMAGDRGDGAFRFAAALNHPVYFATCIAESGCRARAVIRRLPSERHVMKTRYDAILRDLAARFPEQCFTWRR